jgi:hypothetical protein
MLAAVHLFTGWTHCKRALKQRRIELFSDNSAAKSPSATAVKHITGGATKATQELHNLGQSLWLDNITRDLLDKGTLKRYIDEFSVTGLTSNPTIFEHAISKSRSYDSEIGRLTSKGLSGRICFSNWLFRT